MRKRLQNAREMLYQQLNPYLKHGVGEPEWTSSEPIEGVTSQPSQAHEEVASHVVTLRTVPITSLAGVEQYVHLALDHKPTRQLQKLATLRAYVKRHPSGWRKQAQLADLLYTMGHWEEAIDLFHQVRHRQPRHLRVRLRLGRMLRLVRRENEAIDIYREASTLSDRSATQHYVNGCIALCHRCPDEAAQAYADAAASEPGNAAYARALGRTWLQVGRHEEALQAFETILQRDPEDLVALTFSYTPLLVAGHYEEAQRRMERAWQADPGNILALTQLIESRCHTGQVQGAPDTQTKALIRRAIQLARDMPSVQRAAAALLQAQTLAPDDPAIRQLACDLSTGI